MNLKSTSGVTVAVKPADRLLLLFLNRMDATQLPATNKTRETNIAADATGPMSTDSSRVVTPVNTTGCTSRTNSLCAEKGIVAMCFRNDEIVLLLLFFVTIDPIVVVVAVAISDGSRHERYDDTK
jgi:hypothetical protein